MCEGAGGTDRDTGTKDTHPSFLQTWSPYHVLGAAPDPGTQRWREAFNSRQGEPQREEGCFQDGAESTGQYRHDAHHASSPQMPCGPVCHRGRGHYSKTPADSPLVNAGSPLIHRGRSHSKQETHVLKASTAISPRQGGQCLTRLPHA